MNNAGARNERLIVVLNDNDMSIAPPVGALSSYLARISSSGTYLQFREIGRQLARKLPKYWERQAARAEEYTRTYWTGGTLFEELGFYYVGPIDGHDLDILLPVLKNVRDAQRGPILVHVVTRKGKGYGPAEGIPLEIGRGRVVREGTTVAILSLGTRLAESLAAADKLAAFGLSATVADARFAKPIDADLVRRLATNHEVLITIEEGGIGGFATQVLHFLATSGLLDRGLKVRPMMLPDVFIDHDKPEKMYQQAGLDSAGIVATALNALGRDSKAFMLAERA